MTGWVCAGMWSHVRSAQARAQGGLKQPQHALLKAEGGHGADVGHRLGAHTASARVGHVLVLVQHDLHHANTSEDLKGDNNTVWRVGKG